MITLSSKYFYIYKRKYSFRRIENIAFVEDSCLYRVIRMLLKCINYREK